MRPALFYYRKTTLCERKSTLVERLERLESHPDRISSIVMGGADEREYDRKLNIPYSTSLDRNFSSTSFCLNKLFCSINDKKDIDQFAFYYQLYGANSLIYFLPVVLQKSLLRQKDVEENFLSNKVL